MAVAGAAAAVAVDGGTTEPAQVVWGAEPEEHHENEDRDELLKNIVEFNSVTVSFFQVSTIENIAKFNSGAIQVLIKLHSGTIELKIVDFISVPVPFFCPY